ncbi:hypothetical protein GAY29_10870 [Azospirillum brasilense]|uniref:hypothetical protein n=1 Tax=Azospirillum brasilense TaxID=192 RepID=UPI00190E2CD2|nr:hypothetical protein [Azospirillum brasilense]MBK3733611.1 hypothetical protein [Azospirillum brasilense]
MKYSLKPGRNIYIFCMPRGRTGGPEALHQLGSVLRGLGHNAFMVYVACEIPELQKKKTADDLWNVYEFKSDDDPVVPDYVKYGVPYTFEVVDSPDNIMVLPEVWPYWLQFGENLQKYFWWLSYDNALSFVHAAGGWGNFQNHNCRHLTQSEHAKVSLRSHGIGEVYPLFDFIGSNYFVPSPADKRDNRILYNHKGAAPAEKLAELAPEFLWQPLIGLTSQEVWSFFRTSKLYMDFGYHPGKDRMPREAAVSGCCVITGMRGAAQHFEDISIPGKYKVANPDQDAERVIALVRDIMENFEDHTASFEYYRRKIMSEREEFFLQVRNLF